MNCAEHWRIRPIDPARNDEIELVASRMRETLVEVLGPETGGSLYSMEWLHQRVRQHLDPQQLAGEVFLAEPGGEGRASPPAGHAIVREDRDEEGNPIGLLSTIYVDPVWRKRGAATALLERAEGWMCARGLGRAVTYTATDNLRLIRLMEGRGYRVVLRERDMVALARNLAPPPGARSGGTA